MYLKHFLQILTEYIKLIYLKYKIAISIIIFIIIAFSQSKVPHFNILKQHLTDSIFYILSPLSKIETHITDLSTLLNIRKENLLLKEDNEKLRSYYENISQLLHENIELKKALNYVQEFKFQYITTRIITDISNVYQRNLIVMAGQKDGIKKGQIILNNLGIIGRVTEVGEKFSRVMSINDINSKIPVILVSSRIKAIASGNNSDMMDLQYLANKENIKQGELVVTAEDLEFFPPNIIVGHVIIENNKFKVKPFIDMNILHIVSAIIY